MGGMKGGADLSCFLRIPTGCAVMEYDTKRAAGILGAHAGWARCTLDGVPAPGTARADGAVELRIPSGTRNGRILRKG